MRLREYIKCTDQKAAVTPRSRIRALTDPTFIVALSCAKKVMAVTICFFLGPCRKLIKTYTTRYNQLTNSQRWKKWRGGECEEDMDEWNGGPYGSLFAAHELAKYI
jgi:hypothetical protein